MALRTGCCGLFSLFVTPIILVAEFDMVLVYAKLCSFLFFSLPFSLHRFSFASGAPDNIKVWKFPDGNFLQNFSGHQAIVNSVSINSDNVLVSGGEWVWLWVGLLVSRCLGGRGGGGGGGGGISHGQWFWLSMSFILSKLALKAF